MTVPRATSAAATTRAHVRSAIRLLLSVSGQALCPAMPERPRGVALLLRSGCDRSRSGDWQPHSRRFGGSALPATQPDRNGTVAALSPRAVGRRGKRASSRHHVPVSGPAFVTERLSLRPLGLMDAAPVALMNSDVEVMRFVGGTLSAQASDASVLRSVDQWNARGYGRFAVLSRATGEFVGWVSLFHGHRLYPDDVAIGWRMRRDSGGRA